MLNDLLELISNEKFLKMESLASKPNLFKIVGRTHTETWHSMFLGWLLDPNASHGLGDFPLKRLLVATSKPTLQEDDINKSSVIAKIAALGELKKASVIPNELEQREVNCSAGRIDVFITNISSQKENDTVILIEQKVHAPVDKQQCKKYADWLYATYPNENKILLLLAPSDRLGSTIENTTGDGRWNAIDYQSYHDNVLVPVIQFSKASNTTSQLINQYVDTLRIPANGRKLAVTDEEKELAMELYEKHKNAFDSIFAALRDEEDINYSSFDSAEKTKLEIKVNDELIKGARVKDFYCAAMKYLVKNNLLTENNVPYETSPKRYLIATKPKHQNGNPFKGVAEHNGYFMETNISKLGAIKILSKFLKSIGCKVTVREE